MKVISVDLCEEVVVSSNGQGRGDGVFQELILENTPTEYTPIRKAFCVLIPLGIDSQDWGQKLTVKVDTEEGESLFEQTFVLNQTSDTKILVVARPVVSFSGLGDYRVGVWTNKKMIGSKSFTVKGQR